MKSPANCAVIIPTFQGAGHLPELVARLRQQTLAPTTILVIDSSSRDGSADLARSLGCVVEVIRQAEFSHGGTRNRAARQTHEEILVFLTQDALPADDVFLERLVAPLVDGSAAASYARQTAHPHATPPEQLARAWNYPAAGHLRSAEDIPRLGIKAFFFSNVASAMRRETFADLGGFPEDVIMNEDMVLCARLLAAGHRVAYCAEAVVRHSHDYALAQQFRRYFDIGVFFRSHGHLLGGGRAGGEGMRFALAQFTGLLRRGHLWWALRSPCESATKLVAFHLGKRHPLLPRALKRRCSMHAFHWDRDRGSSIS